MLFFFLVLNWYVSGCTYFVCGSNLLIFSFGWRWKGGKQFLAL